MQFNDTVPKMLLNYEPANRYAEKFFVYLQDKVPFMDCAQPNDYSEFWVTHTKEFGEFQVYFHLHEGEKSSDFIWDMSPVCEHIYYIDTGGVYDSIPMPDNAHVITYNTHEELWEHVKNHG